MSRIKLKSNIHSIDIEGCDYLDKFHKDDIARSMIRAIRGDYCLYDELFFPWEPYQKIWGVTLSQRMDQIFEQILNKKPIMEIDQGTLILTKCVRIHYKARRLYRIAAIRYFAQSLKTAIDIHENEENE